MLKESFVGLEYDFITNFFKSPCLRIVKVSHEQRLRVRFLFQPIKVFFDKFKNSLPRLADKF